MHACRTNPVYLDEPAQVGRTDEDVWGDGHVCVLLVLLKVDGHGLGRGIEGVVVVLGQDVPRQTTETIRGAGRTAERRRLNSSSETH